MTQGNRRAARGLLGHTLNLDAANRPARFTLAQLDLRPIDDAVKPIRRAQAVSELLKLRVSAAHWSTGGWWKRQARKVIRTIQARRPEWDDPYWYRATYVLATEIYHSTLELQTDSPRVRTHGT